MDASPKARYQEAAEPAFFTLQHETLSPQEGPRVSKPVRRDRSHQFEEGVHSRKGHASCQSPGGIIRKYEVTDNPTPARFQTGCKAGNKRFEFIRREAIEEEVSDDEIISRTG